MIPIKLQPEPDDFLRKVRQPGEAFLAKISNPSKKSWTKHSYWTKTLPDLYEAYGGICAYSCHWIPLSGARSIDHFKPKAKYPHEAYCWENYRLVSEVINQRKGDREDILDPFTLQDGWFIIDFPSLLVRPSSHIAAADAQCVKTTIAVLGLNDGGTCLGERKSWLHDYITAPLPFPFLERRTPFLASELKRQNLVERIREIMRY